MSVIYLESKQVPDIIRRVFPEYRGPSFKVQPSTEITLLDDSWSGGSKKTYRLLNLSNGECSNQLREFGNPFTNQSGNIPTLTIPLEFAVICHTIFCGNDLGITIYINPQNLNLMNLGPPQTALTDDEKKALNIIGGIKSGYRQSEWERHSLPGRYTAENPILLSLSQKSLVKINKAGISITTNGRNMR